MYKQLLWIITAFSMASSVAFAQQFSFQAPKASSSMPRPAANTTREPPASPQSFANSTTKAYVSQQTKVSEMATQKIKETQARDAAAKQSTQQPIDGAQKPATPATMMAPSTIQPAPMPLPKTTATNPPAEAPSQPASTYQPYTGFQSPSKSAPSNHQNKQNTGGWGSGVQY